MPVLDSPEVTATRHSGLTFYRQDAMTDISGLDFDTEADTDLLGHLGLNPIISEISLKNLDVTGHPIISLHISLRDEWKGKDALLATIQNEHGISASQESCPYGSNKTTLVVKGADEILVFGEHLRTSFEKSAREDGAVYYRPIIHPALLGQIMDDVVEAIEQSKVTNPDSWHHGAYVSHYDWRG